MDSSLLANKYILSTASVLQIVNSKIFEILKMPIILTYPASQKWCYEAMELPRLLLLWSLFCGDALNI